MDRWEWLEGIKAESATSVAVKHLAKIVADELLEWPPRVEVTQEQFRSKFVDILSPGTARPTRRAFEEAIRRARWELARDFDAIDFYERNGHLAKAIPDARDRLASEFIQHYILEAFFVLMEKTDYRVKRPDIKRGLDWVERRIEVAWGGLSPKEF